MEKTALMTEAQFTNLMVELVKGASQMGWEDYYDSSEEAHEDFLNYLTAQSTESGWDLRYEVDGYAEEVGSFSKTGEFKAAADAYDEDCTNRIGEQIEAWLATR